MLYNLPSFPQLKNIFSLLVPGPATCTSHSHRAIRIQVAHDGSISDALKKSGSIAALSRTSSSHHGYSVQAWRESDCTRKEGSKLEPEFVVEFGSPAACIVNEAEKRNINLIVLGIRSQADHLGLTGTHLPGHTAYSVVSQASCPVLTVRGGTPCS